MFTAGILLAAMVGIAYLRSLSAPFIFDDQVAVVENPTIRRLGWTALRPPRNGGTTTGRPLVNLSYAFDYAISGAHAWSYHLTNVVIHGLATLLLFGLTRRTLRLAQTRSNPGPWPSAYGERIPFFAAALWGLHPLQTESVVGIAQRTESLCGLFYLLTLYAFARAAGAAAADAGGSGPPAASSRPTGGCASWLFVAWTACLLGMATKEVMVTAPVVVLLFDRTFVAGSFRAAWRARRRWYGALAATWVLLAGLLIHGGGARGASAGFGRGLSAWDYLLTQCEAIPRYVQLACWPHPLVLDYGTGVVTHVADVAWQGLLLIAALAGTVWALVRKPVLGFAAACFFLLLAPSSSFVPLVTQTMAEHRMYLPLAVITTTWAWWIGNLVRRPGWLLLPVVAALGGLTIARIHDYRDPVAIWTDNVAKWPRGARGHNNLALALQTAGRPADADAQFARAVAIDPGYVTAHYNYGVALLGQGRVAAAVEQLSAAVNLAPDHVDAQVNLGNALVRAGRAADAVRHYEAALRIAPAADIKFDLGIALLAISRKREAAQQFQAAVELAPSLAPAHVQLGRMADDGGDAVTAEREYRQALRYAPDDASAHAALGLLLARGSRLREAEEHLRAAIRLSPGDVDARANLGNVLLLQGRAREAITCYEEVMRRRPNDPRTRENLELARAALR